MYFFSFLCITLALPLAAPSYADNPDEAVSWCIADVTGDGHENVIVISGGGVTDDGLRYGDRLKVYGAEALISACDLASGAPVKKNSVPLLNIDIGVLKPLKVQAGDIDGCGRLEIALCVYKTAVFHPVMAKRPFFYRLENGGIEPVWLGSRLSRPFDDYILADVNADGIDEIVAIEHLQNGDKTVCAYYWKGFGFEFLMESRAFEGELTFEDSLESDVAVRDTGSDIVYKLLPDVSSESFITEELKDN